VSVLGFIIAAAGQGRRLGAGYNKVFLPLGDKPVIAYSLSVAETSALVDEVVVVTRPEEKSLCERIVAEGNYRKVKEIVPGGRERQDSVFAGINALSNGVDYVAVHDGARPFLSSDLLEKVVMAAKALGAAVAALPVKETVKMSDGRDLVKTTLDRKYLWAVQTPQVFRYDWLVEAYRQGKDKGWQVTDDAALVEKYKNY